ncbi:MAG: hypothetical protein QHJ73_16225, partial [Armatimonadota bacterium]|nr:hypothetical protein [Armatimonadota bacterium]
TLREGRNRQVRRMLDAVGHPVERLQRVAVGPVSIRKVPVGGWRYLSQKELHALRKVATTPVSGGAGAGAEGAKRQPGAPAAGVGKGGGAYASFGPPA